MTCKGYREYQLEELKAGVPELSYVLERLAPGTWHVAEKQVFETLRDAMEAYKNMARTCHPGFIRLHAEVEISPYDYPGGVPTAPWEEEA